ncbi:50S ribosomal protein L5 [Candidatus Woesearchaeota archaeon]|nr:50S ribosomal protein L5 [Candidatus Woesearchaeota archaeon]MBW3013746.1 50S ribosomal protein L5 [Candidatus Woesearchaeota archaeon]
MSNMREIRIEKLTLNFGAGKDQSRLDKGIKLIKTLAGRQPVKTLSKERIAAWGLRKNLPIGCKLTIRGAEAGVLLKRLLRAKENKLKSRMFDDQGNFSFGIHEYIDLPDIKYDADIGILGFEAAITLTRPGFRIKNRKYQKKKIPSRHRISKEDAMEFIKTNFDVTIVEA